MFYEDFRRKFGVFERTGIRDLLYEVFQIVVILFIYRTY